MQDSMRRVLIDRLLSDKSVVTLQELQDVLKVSIPTIKRDLRYMRKELKAPIVYSRTRGGYLYDLPAGKSGASPEFQRFWFSAQELYVVVKMVDMLKALSKDKSSVILQDLEPLRSRVAGLLNLGGKSPREILGRVKVIDPSVIHGEPETFLTIGSALFEHKRVQISYYSRTRKPDAEAVGMAYKPLAQLLTESEVVCSCLNKNVLLLGKDEFAQLGAGKALFTATIGPGFDSAALEQWLALPGTHFFCDTRAAAGPVDEDFFARENVHCANVSAGRTKQAFVLLSQKVLANIRTALGE